MCVISMVTLMGKGVVVLGRTYLSYLQGSVSCDINWSRGRSSPFDRVGQSAAELQYYHQCVCHVTNDSLTEKTGSHQTDCPNSNICH